MKSKIANFSAGPAAIPQEVLQEVKDELLNYKNIGSSIIEISHRDKTFVDIANQAKIDVIDLLNVPNDYEVIFLQGGATLQFSMIPLNFSYLGKVANFAEIGSWSSKAIKEASNICKVNVCTSSKDNNFTKIENFDEWNIVQDTSIVHYCKNETIQGVRVNHDIETNYPLFVDMSSCLFSETIDIKKYDFIYACAQKNFGPSGITLIILKRELLEKSNKDLPNILKYDAHAKENSMLNTPNTFGWYVAGKIFSWYKKKGGVKEMEKNSIKKTNHLYQIIDNSDFYINPVFQEQRSICNVVFTLQNDELESKFLSGAEENGLFYLKGHRSVGGMRASIYNPLEFEHVERLGQYMIDFEKKYG